MKKIITIFYSMVLSVMIFGQCPDILPTSDFSINFCNFPFAWEVTKGENVTVGILTYENSDQTAWIKQIQKLAPASTIHHYSLSSFLNRTLIDKELHVVFIANEIKTEDYDKFTTAVEFYKDMSVVMPAYFGQMRDWNYSNWQNLLRKSSELGAIIAGSHGGMYQLGDLSFWKDIPVDVFAIMRQIPNRFPTMMSDFKIAQNLDGSSYLVVGAVALLKSKYPGYSNYQLKQLLREKVRRVFWSLIENPEGGSNLPIAISHFDKDYLGKYEDDRFRKLERNVFEASSLDLMTLFGFSCPEFGGWCFQNLNIEDAQKEATGKGVTVAILDHTFNKNHEALKNRITSPKSFIDGVPALSEMSDHGTRMAIDLVIVAPDVNIMPIVMSGGDHWGDAELFIKAINYAVENGADIISCSQMAIKGDQNRLDEAIENATSKGVTFVYINYGGEREEVIIPRPVEFARNNDNSDIVYIIGTNFIDKESPFTWGVSPTAPIVSGVISLLKEVNPDLTPEEIKSILLKSTKASADGIPILDSYKALQSIL